MKKIFLLGLMVALFNSCTECPQGQFTSNSSQIDVAKQIHQHYLAGEWSEMAALYSEDANILYNTLKSSTLEEAQATLQQLLTDVENYTWEYPINYEQVTNEKGEVWVYFWGRWQASLKANGAKVSIPVHVAWNFEGDKVKNEFGFWDNTPLFQALEAAGAESAAEEGNDDGA